MRDSYTFPIIVTVIDILKSSSDKLVHIKKYLRLSRTHFRYHKRHMGRMFFPQIQCAKYGLSAAHSLYIKYSRRDPSLILETKLISNHLSTF